MSRKGILFCSLLVAILGWITPVVAGETVEEITTMMNWWEDVGSTWEEARDVIELAGDELPPEPVYALADNTPEREHETQ